MARASTTAAKGTKVDPVSGRFPEEKIRKAESSGSSPLLLQFIQVREEEKGREPKKSYPGDAGHDLFCSRHVSVEPGGKMQVPTGIAVDIPEGYFGWVTPRSGTFYRKGLIVHPGIVDSGYRGEVQILAYNPGQRKIFIAEGERIAQLIILPVVKVEFSEVARLTPGDRGEAGFGSTGGLGGE